MFQGAGAPKKQKIQKSDDANKENESSGPFTRSQGAVSVSFQSPEKPRAGSRCGFNQYFQSPQSRPPLARVKFSPNGKTPSLEDSSSPIKSYGSPAASGKPKTIETDSRTLHLRIASSRLTFYSEKRPVLEESPCPTGTIEFKTERFTTHLNRAVLDFMARRKLHYKSRVPDQRYFFGNVNAIITAAAQGFSNKNGEDWQYCHIFGFSLGGLFADKIIKANAGEYRNKKLKLSPQDIRNLFIGTTACNGQMLIIENIIKQILWSGGADWVEISTEIDYLSLKGAKTKMADELRYTVKFYKNGIEDSIYVDEFVFRPLSLHKPLKSCTKHLRAEIDRLMGQGSDLAEAEDFLMSPSI